MCAQIFEPAPQAVAINGAVKRNRNARSRRRVPPVWRPTNRVVPDMLEEPLLDGWERQGLGRVACDDDLWHDRAASMPVGTWAAAPSKPPPPKRKRSPAPVRVLRSLQFQDEAEEVVSAPRPKRQGCGELWRATRQLSYATVARGKDAIHAALAASVRAGILAKRALLPEQCPVRPLCQERGHQAAPGIDTTVMLDQSAEAATHGAITNRANRKMRPSRFTNYVLPKLVELGGLASSRDPDLEGFIQDGLLRVETGKGYVVPLPAGVVEHAIAWLAGKERTLAMQRMLYVKVNELIRDLDLSPRELAVCAWFVPLVAWSRTESAHIEHGVYMRRQFMGRAVYVRLATAAATLACLVPSAAAAGAAGAGAAVVAPIAAVAAGIACGAATLLAAWSAGYAKPPLGPRYAPRLLTRASEAVVDAAVKEGAFMERAEPVAVKASDVVTPSLTPVGLCDRKCVPIALAPNHDNEVLAVQARVIAETPIPDEETVEHFVKWVKANLYTICGTRKRRPFSIKAMAFDDWVTGCGCSNSVREVYKATRDSLSKAGISENSCLDARSLHSFTTRASFVKLETTLHTDARKAPRLIQGAQPEMTVLTGPWFVPFQGWLKQRLSPAHSSVVYGPGLDQRSVATHIASFEGRVEFIEDDVSTWDASVRPKLLRLLIWIYQQFGAPRAVVDLKDANVETHGYTRTGIKYGVPGTVKSGDTDTSCGNTLLNLLLHLFIYCEGGDRSITVEQALCEFGLVATGDDDVLMVPPRVDIDWAACMRSLGFASKPIKREVLSDVEFCSCFMLPVTYTEGEGWALLPKLGRMISKSAVSLRCPRDEDRLRILRGTALSLRAVCSGSPPHRAFINRLLELTAGHDAIRPADEPWKMAYTSSGVDDPRTHVALERRYGWTPALQRDFEAELATVNQACVFADLPICRMFQECDGDRPEDSVMSSSAALNGVPFGEPVVSRYTEDDIKVDDQGNLVPPLPRVGPEPAEDWSPSRKKRNQITHALNGNASRPAGAEEAPRLNRVDLEGKDGELPPFDHMLLLDDDCEENGCLFVRFADSHFAVEFVEGSSLHNVLADAWEDSGYPAFDWSRVDVYVNGRPAAFDALAMDGTFVRVDAKLMGGKPGKKAKLKKAVITVVKPKKRGKQVVVAAIKGKGDYQTTFGGRVGSSIGGFIGHAAQKAIMAITGMGDYKVKSNTIMNGTSPPAFAAGKHCTKFCHREFVTNITTPGSAFSIQQFEINPKSALFPWLSEIALSFEQFIVRGMVVEYKTTSATSIASTNTALGSVIIATQYNVLAPAFIGQQQMEAYEYCTSCAPSLSMIHPIECDPSLNSLREFFVDSSSGDPRLENLGTVYVATVGQQAASQIGELWVSYEMDLIRPKLYVGVANLGITSIARVLFSQNVGYTFTQSPANASSAYFWAWMAANASQDTTNDFAISFGGVNTPYGNCIGVPGWVRGTFLTTLYIDLNQATNTIPGASNVQAVAASDGSINSVQGQSAYQVIRGGSNPGWVGQDCTWGGQMGYASAQFRMVNTYTGTRPGETCWIRWIFAGSSSGSDQVQGAMVMMTGVSNTWPHT